MESGFVPSVRAGVVTRTVGEESVVYDRAGERVHSLDRTAAAVLARVDGTASVADISSALAIPVESVESALVELDDAGLVSIDDQLRNAGRRRAMRTVAAAGAAGVALPVITSVVAPSVAAAQTGGNGGSTDPGGDPDPDPAPLGESTITHTGLKTLASRPPTQLYDAAVLELFVTRGSTLVGRVEVDSTSTLLGIGANGFNFTGPVTITWSDSNGVVGTSTTASGTFSTQASGFDSNMQPIPPNFLNVPSLEILSGMFVGDKIPASQLEMSPLPNPMTDPQVRTLSPSSVALSMS